MDRISHKTKIDVFENAFRKIKQVGIRWNAENGSYSCSCKVHLAQTAPCITDSSFELFRCNRTMSDRGLSLVLSEGDTFKARA